MSAIHNARERFLKNPLILPDQQYVRSRHWKQELTMRAQSTVTLGLEDARRIVKLLDMLEDLDDVQQVYSNADIPEEILAQLAS